MVRLISKLIDLTISLSWVPLSSTPPSVQHISSTQKGHSFSAPKSLSSTPKTPQFNTNPSVPHQKTLSSTPLSSTPKTPQFHPRIRIHLIPAEFHSLVVVLFFLEHRRVRNQGLQQLNLSNFLPFHTAFSV